MKEIWLPQRGVCRELKRFKQSYNMPNLYGLRGNRGSDESATINVMIKMPPEKDGSFKFVCAHEKCSLWFQCSHTGRGEEAKVGFGETHTYFEPGILE